MNQGPLIFLGVFFALALSWFGLIVGPELQLGNAQQATNVVNPTQLYPQMRPGQARQGLDVYRSLGCAACHTQQIDQTGRVYDVVLNEVGTNQNAVVEALLKANLIATAAEAPKLLETPKLTILRGVARALADATAGKLEAAGAKAQIKIIPTGPDMARGWGIRRSVAEDSLFDEPVMLGSQRVGPDLADVGSRPALTAEWHLLHLYNPRFVVEKSVMPPYPFLFEKRRINREPSPDALKLAAGLTPEPGYEIVPTDQAKQLVAYLFSLRADTVIFDAPVTVEMPAASTNAPAAATNAAPVK